MKYGIIHLSDLHYCCDEHESYEVIWRALSSDLKQIVDKSVQPLLVFSGDFVQAGDAEAQYTAIGDRILALMSDSGIKSENCVIVPGNHDISTQVVRKKWRALQGMYGQISSEKVFNEEIGNLRSVFADAAFENYRKFETRMLGKDHSSDLGGYGIEIEENIAIFCLNTAIYSIGGARDNGQVSSDYGRLMIDTRSIHKWLHSATSPVKVLVMHHPISWLCEWARQELNDAILPQFQLLFSGHEHTATADYISRGKQGTLMLSAPALFSSKSDKLGYSITMLDADSTQVNIKYRQYAGGAGFVLGSVLAGNDIGGHKLNLNDPTPMASATVVAVSSSVSRLLVHLETAFDASIRCYSGKGNIWVDRVLSAAPETQSRRNQIKKIGVSDLVNALTDCIIRAPRLYGATCLAHKIALERFKNSGGTDLLVYINRHELPPYRSDIRKAVLNLLTGLEVSWENVFGFIIDNWREDKIGGIIREEIRALSPSAKIVCIETYDDFAQIKSVVENKSELPDIWYLWALNRGQIRELVHSYFLDDGDHDDDVVLGKVIRDLDALKIHRTPINCLLMLKLIEQKVDSNPVNRTEVIGKVLSILFYKYNNIPQYKTRPDLKDCEYALGFFVEWLVSERRSLFSEKEFCGKIDEYCKTKLINLDIDVLLGFLIAENILLKRGGDLSFRFNYWLYYFAAHRMHHNEAFCSFILDQGRYTADPEIIEFYAGIDRRRLDAVQTVCRDLKAFREGFVSRVGIVDGDTPWDAATCVPTKEAIAGMLEEVTQNANQSLIPQELKDAMVDRGYDSAKPYNQALSDFFVDSALPQLMQTIKCAGRVLRNSDHLDPQYKTELLAQVISSWVSVSQMLVLLSPVLAHDLRAECEGLQFKLDDTFNKYTTVPARWNAIMTSIPHNVIHWFQADIHSSRLGYLFQQYASGARGTYNEYLIMSLLVRQRPNGWHAEVRKYIEGLHKNSFYLIDLLGALRHEYATISQKDIARKDVIGLAAMSLAKHQTGVKIPNKQLIARKVKSIESNFSKLAEEMQQW